MDRSLFENLDSTDDTKIEKAIKESLALKPTEENIYSKFCKILLDTGSVIYNELIINAISPFFGTSIQAIWIIYIQLTIPSVPNVERPVGLVRMELKT